MQELEKKINKNSFEYVLHTRGKNAFIYEQKGKDAFGKIQTFAFEVFRKIVDPEKEVFNTVYPERERFCANEDFGKWAWSIREEDRAIKKFNELENEVQ
jgi:hypothetical protein